MFIIKQWQQFRAKNDQQKWEQTEWAWFIYEEEKKTLFITVEIS